MATVGTLWVAMFVAVFANVLYVLLFKRQSSMFMIIASVMGACFITALVMHNPFV